MAKNSSSIVWGAVVLILSCFSISSHSFPSTSSSSEQKATNDLETLSNRMNRKVASLTTILINSPDTIKRKHLAHEIQGIFDLGGSVRDIVEQSKPELYNSIYDFLASSINSIECDENKILDVLAVYHGIKTPNALVRCYFFAALTHTVASLASESAITTAEQIEETILSIHQKFNAIALELTSIIPAIRAKKQKQKNLLKKRLLKMLLFLMGLGTCVVAGKFLYDHLKRVSMKSVLISAEYTDRVLEQEKNRIAELENQIKQLGVKIRNQENKLKHFENFSRQQLNKLYRFSDDLEGEMRRLFNEKFKLERAERGESFGLEIPEQPRQCNELEEEVTIQEQPICQTESIEQQTVVPSQEVESRQQEPTAELEGPNRAESLEITTLTEKLGELTNGTGFDKSKDRNFLETITNMTNPFSAIFGSQMPKFTSDAQGDEELQELFNTIKIPSTRIGGRYGSREYDRRDDGIEEDFREWWNRRSRSRHY